MLAEVGAMVGAYACGTGLALIPGLRQVLTQTALTSGLRQVLSQAALTPGLRQVLTQTDTLCGLGRHSEGSHAKISKGRCAPVRIPMYAW